MKLYKIKKSNIDKKGRGLYATKDIKAGTKIIDYIGKIITNKQVDESDKFDNSKPIYLFTLNKRYTLDGDFPWNTAGLINHSCDNNCDYDGKGLKIWVTAIKDIKKGERFTPENIRSIRPGLGLKPRFYDEVMDGRSNTNIKKGTPLSKDFIQLG